MDDDSLSHQYDPVKRREYYLKNRHLKGRRHGSSKTAKPRSKSRAEIARERHAHLEQQIIELKGRLERLQAALKVLVNQAKARSGVKPSKTPAKKAAAAQKKADRKPEHLTAVQKAEKAKAQREARIKANAAKGIGTNSQLSAEVKSLNERIKKIQERIDKMHKTGAIGSRNAKTH